jgi:putative phage-type endonuclease
MEEYVINLIKSNNNKQRTKLWKQERKKIITATNVASILELNPYKSKFDLLQEKTSINDINIIETNNTAINWGVKYENNAVKIYEQLKNIKVFEIGLVKHNKYPWIGASPDGIMLNGKLLEIKCPYYKNITEEIAHYYWIQVQIQLEVCNLDECDFLECKFKEFSNEEEYLANNDLTMIQGYNEIDNTYWKLINYKITVIPRDTEWFKLNFNKLLNFYNLMINNKKRKYAEEDMTNTLLSVKKQKIITNINTLIDWKEWNSFSNIYNYIRNDPIIDWLYLYGEKYNYSRDLNNPNGNFNIFMSIRGQIHKYNIYSELNKKFKDDVITIGNNFSLFSTDKVTETIAAINNNIPIIINGIFHNHENKTYGICDLLVRNDYLDKIIKNKNVLLLKGKKERKERKNNIIINKKYYYNIVQIINNSIEINDENMLINNSKIPYLKSQGYLISNILNKICNNNNNNNNNNTNIYIIGSHVKLKNKKYKSLYQYGIVNYNDMDLQEKTNNGFEWLNELKKNGEQWNILKPHRIELYPNMCNSDSYPWNNSKLKIAEQIKEITLIWNLNISDREKFHGNDIYKWDNITSSDFHLIANKNDKNKKIIKNIIQINNTKQLFIKNIDKKNKITKINNKKNNNSSNYLNFYIDFETIFDYNDKNRVYIYLIGIGFIHNNKWIYKYFLMNKINEYEERLIIFKWISYIGTVIQKYNKTKYKLFHWSNAEPQLFKNVNNMYNLHSINKLFKWFDLLDYYKQNEIVVNGCFNYKLKHLVNSLYKHKLTKLQWDNNDIDAISSMVYIWNGLKDQNELSKINNIDKIIKYNEIDCRALYELHKFIDK